ncbi:MAG: hypothetical protein AB7D00_03590 [Rhodospirillaceae bacterium]
MSPAATFAELRRYGWRLDMLYPNRSGREWRAVGVDASGRAASFRGRTPEAALGRLVRACLRSADRTIPVGRRSTGKLGASGLRNAPPPVDRSAADTF